MRGCSRPLFYAGWWNKMWNKIKRVKEAYVKPEVSVVLPAVFEGEGEENPLFRNLGGVPVLARTLQALNEMSLVGEIIVVVREAEILYVADLCKAFELHRVKKVVTGKAPGLLALLAGVFECERSAAYIAIHDPLRPFVTEQMMKDALRLARYASAAVLAVPVKDTIKIVRDDVVQDTPERSTLKSLQTPQVVESSLLKGALIKAKEAGGRAEELPAVLELLGISPQLAKGSEENIRVFKPADIPVAETILAWRGYS